MRTDRRATALPRRLARAACIAALGAALPSLAAAEVRVFACEPEWAALAEEVGGAAVRVYSATHGRQDPHYIRARPSLIAQIRRADLLFCSGGGLEEGWLPILLQRGARVPVQPGQPGHLLASDHVDLLGQLGETDRSRGHVHPEGNPHVHLDPENVSILASELGRRLATIDPDNTETYRRQLAAFQERWSRATAEWEERASRLQDLPVVILHEAWIYLFQWTGIREVAVIEPLPGVPPNASHLRTVLQRAREAGARAILRAPYEPDEGMEWLSEASGIPIVELPYTVGGQPGVDDLFGLFDMTLTLLENVVDRS